MGQISDSLPVNWTGYVNPDGSTWKPWDPSVIDTVPSIWTEAITTTLPFPPIATKDRVPVRGLFEVFIVDPERDLIFHAGEHIASDENLAKLKALMSSPLSYQDNLGVIHNYDIDDIDIIVRRLGDVRVKKVVQEVRTVPTLLPGK